MDEHFIKIHKWLYPASWLYGAVVMMRNKLFDWEVLQSKSFDIPIISVGNLAVGGTGKIQIKEVIKRNYSINNCEGTEQLPKNIYRQRKGEQK